MLHTIAGTINEALLYHDVTVLVPEYRRLQNK